jgi:hypothetical protein
MRPVGLQVSLCLAAAVAGPPAAAAPAAGNPTAAVWKEQHVEFVYMGRTSRYSCGGLRDKMRALLLDLGARRDLKVVPLGCDDYDRPGASSGASRLKIVFSSPALPDAGAKPLHEGDLAATDARFEKFTITGDAFRNMGVGDCELVQEFAHQILPKLAVREVKEDIYCAPNQGSGPGMAGAAKTGTPAAAAPVPVPSAGPRFFVRGEILKTLPRAEVGQRY